MKKLFVGFVFILLGLGCSSLHYTYDRNFNFNRVQTFAFLKKGMQKSHINPIYKKIIAEKVDARLKSKGLLPSIRPDILIEIVPDLHKRIDVYPGPYGKRTEKSWEGNLIIRMIEPKSKKVVWEVRNYLRFSGKKSLIRSLDKKLDKIFEKYPPQ